jgi:hypothetical protein
MPFSIAILMLLFNPFRAISSAAVKMVKMSTFNRIIPGAKWIDLGIPAAELRPNYTLIMGQCFNWKRIDTTDEKGAVSSCWIGMLDSHALAIRQTDTSTLFANLLNNESMDNSRNDDVIRRLLCDYFQTDHSLETLYGSWNEVPYVY